MGPKIPWWIVLFVPSPSFYSKKKTVIELFYSLSSPFYTHSELEEPCLLDLGKYCSENVEKGNEVDCLQDNYDKLSEDCQQSVVAITEREADDIGQNRLVYCIGFPNFNW